MVGPEQAQLSQETVSALGALRSGDPDRCCRTWMATGPRVYASGQRYAGADAHGLLPGGSDDPAAGLEERGNEVSLTEFRDQQMNVPDPGGQGKGR